MTTSHNVWATGSCGPTDRTSPGLMETFTDEWRPQPGSPVIDAADPEDHPRTDLRGRVRGDLPDAGAYESAD